MLGADRWSQRGIDRGFRATCKTSCLRRAHACGRQLAGTRLRLSAMAGLELRFLGDLDVSAGRAAVAAAAVEEDARAARLPRPAPAALSPRAPVRAAVGDPGRPARLAALEPVEAAPPRRRRDASAHRRRPAPASASTRPDVDDRRRGAARAGRRAARRGPTRARSSGRGALSRQLPRRARVLELPRLPRLVRRRARAGVARALRLLRELVRRLGDEPERALPHARALVGLFALRRGPRRADPAARAARQTDEAEQQYQLGLRMLKEAGLPSTGALLARAARCRGSTRRPSHAGRARPVAERAAVAADDARRSRRRDGADRRRARRDAAQSGTRRSCCCHRRAGHRQEPPARGGTGRAASAAPSCCGASAFESEAIRPFALWIDALRELDPTRPRAVFGDADVRTAIACSPA